MSISSNGYGNLVNSKVEYIYVDILFSSNPAAHPYYNTGWDVVETLTIPNFLYECLDFYALDADPNIWFIKHISETFGRDFRYVGANNSAFFNSLIIDKDGEIKEGPDIAQFTYRLNTDKNAKVFLAKKTHEAFSWKYFKSET